MTYRSRRLKRQTTLFSMNLALYGNHLETFPSLLEKLFRKSSKNNNAKLIKPSKYGATAHFSPTTNFLKRLFSKAKLVYSYLRKSVTPFHLQLILFILDVHTIQTCIKNGKVRDQEAIPLQARFRPFHLLQGRHPRHGVHSRQPTARRRLELDVYDVFDYCVSPDCDTSFSMLCM